MSPLQRIFAPRRAMVGVIAMAGLAGTAYYLYQLYKTRRPKKVSSFPQKTSAVHENRIDNEDTPGDGTDDEDDLEPFLPVIDALHQDALKRFAVQARLSQFTTSPADSDIDLICTISEEPVAGSFNLVYFISF